MVFLKVFFGKKLILKKNQQPTSRQKSMQNYPVGKDLMYFSIYSRYEEAMRRFYAHDCLCVEEFYISVAITVVLCVVS